MSIQRATLWHVLVFWEEEGLTTIVKTSQVVDPSPEKGSKANVKWGRRVLPATILAIGNKVEMKRKQEEFHKNGCDAEVLKDSDDAPPKKRKHAKATASKQVKKGKKGVNILCVTQPPEQDSEGLSTACIAHNGPTTAGIFPDGPTTTGIAPDGPTTTGITQDGPTTTGITQDGPTTAGIAHDGPTTAGIAHDGPTTAGIAHDGPTTTGRHRP